MDTNEKTYTIYIHETPVGKRYVGMTSFNPPTMRFQRGYRGNKEFWADITKYGWDKIKTTYVAEANGYVNACVIEKAFIEAYGTMDPTLGYNMVNNRQGVKTIAWELPKRKPHRKSGYHHSEETRAKMSEAHRKISEARRKEVYQYDLDGNFIARYKSIKEASRAIGKVEAHNRISRVCRGLGKTAYGYVWKSEGITEAD